MGTGLPLTRSEYKQAALKRRIQTYKINIDIRATACTFILYLSCMAKKKEIIYTPQEAADRLKVNRTTLWRWANKGKVKFRKIGGSVRYFESDLLKALK